MYKTSVVKILKTHQDESSFTHIIEKHNHFLWSGKIPLDEQWNSNARFNKFGKLSLEYVNDNSCSLTFNGRNIKFSILDTIEDRELIVFHFINLVRDIVDIRLCIDSLEYCETAFAVGDFNFWSDIEYQFDDSILYTRFSNVPENYERFQTCLEDSSYLASLRGLPSLNQYKELMAHLPRNKTTDYISIEKEDGCIDSELVVNMLISIFNLYKLNFVIVNGDDILAFSNSSYFDVVDLMTGINSIIKPVNEYNGYVTRYNFTDCYIYDDNFSVIVKIYGTMRMTIWDWNVRDYIVF